MIRSNPSNIFFGKTAHISQHRTATDEKEIPYRPRVIFQQAVYYLLVCHASDFLVAQLAYLYFERSR